MFGKSLITLDFLTIKNYQIYTFLYIGLKPLFSTPNHRYFLHKLHLVNYLYFHPRVENSFLICIYLRKEKNKRRRNMRLKIKLPNGFKSDLYISPEFISAIGMLVTTLHLAGII